MEDPEWWQHERRPHNDTWRAPLYMETSCMTRKIKPFTHPYLSHMERHPKILETLSAKPSQQGKIPTSKGSQFTIHYYISTRPHLFSGTQKLSISLTIEFLETSHSLTWPSKGFWPIPHRCLLLGPFVLIHRYPLEQPGAYNSLKILAHHQLAPFVGNTTVINHITTFETKELHGPNAFDGYHQPGIGNSSNALGK